MQLLHHYGSAEAIFQAQEGELSRRFSIEAKGIESLRDKNLAGSEEIMAACDRKGIRIMTYADTDFPDRLKQIGDPPIVLYIRGTWRAIDEELAIGIVGPREPSAYGMRVAKEFGAGLAKRGAVVVSGVAQGVDTTAVHNCLAAGGYAVSVLGNGVDVVYPKFNAPIYEDLAARGALISEYPPGAKPAPNHFLVRNRLIAGLSLGVVVVEAKMRSGTLNTANHANAQNRDCFAVPGDIYSETSAGTNRLLRDGLAIPATSVSDILREYEHLYPHLRRNHPVQLSEPLPEILVRQPETEKTVDNSRKLKYISFTDAQKEYFLTKQQISILRALEGKTLTLDELVEDTKLPVLEVTGAITYLELEEYVIQTPEKRYYATLGIKEK